MKFSTNQLVVGFSAGIGIIMAQALVGAEAKIIIARIIDKDTAETVLEGPVKDPTPRNIDGRDGYYSKCNYYSLSGDKRLIVRVYQPAHGSDPHKELDQVAENSGSMRSISGLGDKARISRGAEGGLPSRVVMLYVIKGNSLITIGLSGFEDEAAGEKVKSVAQKILAQL
jgi:NAD(P)-dependent dehydrogenase (short-subunit alcohol dehydrogenase family)